MLTVFYSPDLKMQSIFLYHLFMPSPSLLMVLIICMNDIVNIMFLPLRRPARPSWLELLDGLSCLEQIGRLHLHQGFQAGTNDLALGSMVPTLEATLL